MKYTYITLLIILILSCNSTKNNNMDNQEFNHQVLHDIWALSEMNNEALKLDNERERPILELYIEEKRLGGKGVCNTVFGRINLLEKNQIEFSKIGSTRKMCNNQQLEYDYLRTLEKTATYQIKELHLYLYDTNKNEILKFKKID